MTRERIHPAALAQNFEWLLTQQAQSNAYVYLAVPDFKHLRRLVDEWTDEAHPARRALAAKLRRGIPCGPEPLHDIVTVGAEIEFSREPRSAALESCVLAYPDEPGSDRTVPVTHPFGALLLGLREGQVINQRSPDGKPFYLRVERVRPAVRPPHAAAGAREALVVS